LAIPLWVKQNLINAKYGRLGRVNYGRLGYFGQITVELAGLNIAMVNKAK
jgi:hypothetical protein